jgi:glutamine synthetase
LFEGDKNAFFDAAAEYELSKTARNFMAGVLPYAPDMCLITNQFVNSYKRLWGGAEAPNYICWGHNNRSALLRVPMYKPGKPQTARVEFRGMDSAVNPYLAFAMILSAGLKGIEEDLQLGSEAEDDVWSLTDAERRALGIAPLPRSLDEAARIMADSELAAETLGEHVFEFVLRNKRQEWTEYRAQVTAYELERFLPIL